MYFTFDNNIQVLKQTEQTNPELPQKEQSLLSPPPAGSDSSLDMDERENEMKDCRKKVQV